jgi:hypothetical protein
VISFIFFHAAGSPPPAEDPAENFQNFVEK